MINFENFTDVQIMMLASHFYEMEVVLLNVVIPDTVTEEGIDDLKELIAHVRYTTASMLDSMQARVEEINAKLAKNFKGGFTVVSKDSD